MTKEYISCLNFFNEFYYLQDDNENVLELFNPTNATRFSCAEDAINFAKEKTSAGDYAMAISVEEAFEKWNRFTSPDNFKRSFKKVNESFSRKYNPEKDTPLDVIKMRIVMRENDGAVRYEDYKTWPEPYQLYQHVFAVEGYANDLNSDSDDFSFSFSFSMKIDEKKELDIDVFKEELSTILPFITRKEDDYCVIRIFDHFLSEGGNACSFYYKNDDDCFIKRNGSFYPKIGTNLEECLVYWKKNRYY